MPSTTVSAVILTAVILGIVLITTSMARSFVATQNQPAVYLELRNLTFMVEEQAVSVAAAAKQVNGPIRVQVNMPRALYGDVYTVSFARNTLVSARGDVKFTTSLPSIQGVVWADSVYKSGGTRVTIIANVTSGLVYVSLSN